MYDCMMRRFLNRDCVWRFRRKRDNCWNYFIRRQERIISKAQNKKLILIGREEHPSPYQEAGAHPHWGSPGVLPKTQGWDWVAELSVAEGGKVNGGGEVVGFGLCRKAGGESKNNLCGNIWFRGLSQRCKQKNHFWGSIAKSLCT